MKAIIGFPCYKRLHTQATKETIYSLLTTDADFIAVGVTDEEYLKESDNLPKENRIFYLPTVAGIGCGGDMRSTALAMRNFLENDNDILAMCDDDVKIIKNPIPSFKEWANKWINQKDYKCLFAFDETNFQKRMDWEVADCPPKKGNYFEVVTRNCSPFVVSSVENWDIVDYYDPGFPVGNDADIQQRFNLIGESVLSSEMYVKRGAFQEGGMSSFFKERTWAGNSYQRSTAKALLYAKIKYPWMSSSFISFLKDGRTRANWRIDQRILEEYRKKYNKGEIDINSSGLKIDGKLTTLYFSKKDLEIIEKLEKMWEDWKFDE